MNALTFLKSFLFLPWNPAKPDGKWSSSDLIRAFSQGSIIVGGGRWDSKQEIPEGASIVFFPSSSRRTTFW